MKAGATKAPPAKKAAKAPAKNAPAKNAPAKKAPAKTSAAKTLAAREDAAKTAPAAKVPAKKAAATKQPTTKQPTTKQPATKAAPHRAPAAKKAPPAKRAGAPAAPPVPKGSEWTRAELRAVRAQLVDELNQMTLAYDRSLSDLNDLQRASTDGAGDDQADAGNKTFEREQEQSIAANRFDLLAQIRRAVERIDAGTYGYCESCGKPIPKARLKAFPSATLDVACKQREERR